jgi:hypothetical protein
MKNIFRRFFFKDNEKVTKWDLSIIIVFIIIYYITPIILIISALNDGSNIEKKLESNYGFVLELIIKGFTFIFQYILYSALAIGFIIALVLPFGFLYHIIKEFFERNKKD